MYVKFGVLQTEPRETAKLPYHLFMCLVMMARYSFPGTATVAGPEPHKKRKERAEDKSRSAFRGTQPKHACALVHPSHAGLRRDMVTSRRASQRSVSLKLTCLPRRGMGLGAVAVSRVLDRESDRHSPPFWVVLAQLTTAESPSWEAPAARLKRACPMVPRDEAIQ